MASTREVSVPTAKKQNADSNETRLITAAIRCIDKYGCGKTFIEDIAKEAGLSRPTAYRTFRTRQALFEKLADIRMGEMVEALREQISHYETFEEALVRGIVYSVNLARKDQIFMAILEAAGYHGLDWILNGKSHVMKFQEAIWVDTVSRARAAGEVRDDLTNHDVFDYIRAMEVVLISKEHQSRKDQHAFLKRFMWPAIRPGRVGANFKPSARPRRNIKT